ncbi:MAG TPA: hypothetical protein VKD23_20140 [Terriglobales bacterium]|nr:hypothetical protein [Terriglobales bacterium]
MEIDRSLLALNFEGVPINQQRQNVAARNYRVYVNRLPVQAAIPSGDGFFKLEPVGLAIHYDVINH